MKKATLTGLTLAALTILIAGCSDNNTTNPPGPRQYRDLQVNFSSMTPHIGQLMDFRVITSDDNLQARAFIDPLFQADEKFIMPLAVPNGVAHLDFFADLNLNRAYDTPPTDHAWRIDLPDTGRALVSFTHNTNFTDISNPPFTDMGSVFTLNLTGFTPHLGQMFELHVIEQGSGRTVGLYRLNIVIASDFTLTIPGIIRDGVAYQVDFYADLSGNRGYNPPPIDHAWRLTGTGGSGGLTLNMSHNTNWTDIGFQNP